MISIGELPSNGGSNTSKILYHGTAKKNLDAILLEGLKSMSRQYVHLSETVEEAIKVGKRHGDPVVLAIDTQKVIDDGECFYQVPNGIWLVRVVKSQNVKLFAARQKGILSSKGAYFKELIYGLLLYLC